RGRIDPAPRRAAVAGRQPAPAVRGRVVGAVRPRPRGRGGQRLEGVRGGARVMKLLKLIANLGYGSRKEVTWMFGEGRVTDDAGDVLHGDDQVEPALTRIDGEPLDPPVGLLLMLHNPVGYTCSTKDKGRLIYDLLPPRYRLRSPRRSSVGRLDR